jgi:hypothetical protein
MISFLSGLVGALIGAFVAGAFHFWKLRRDELNARCDELCKVVLEAGAIAAEYWASDFKYKLSDARIAEAKVLGAQSLIDGLYAELRIRLREEEALQIDQLMSDLVDSLTGGKFTVQDRDPDPSRTQSSTQSASLLVVAIRRAHRNTMPLARLAQIANENRHRKLDMPHRVRRSPPPGKTNGAAEI